VVAAEKAGIPVKSLKEEYPRVSEIPFDSTRKMMTTVHRTPEGKLVAYVKGATEMVLERSTKILDREVRDLTQKDIDENLAVMQSMAEDALRVLGMAYKELPDDYDVSALEVDEVEADLVYVGLMGMIDPAREEVPAAIRMAAEAGIRSVMVTGDHRITAVAIAKQIGILKEETNESVLEGIEIEALTDDQLDDTIENVRVCARVSPEHKMRIALSLKRLNHIVAMTGDGVNDAPALKAADIGIAMGIKGTDVTKEASDMVLEDDNFATIVHAIRGGREIYTNVTKYIRLMLAANFDEFLEITVTAVLGQRTSSRGSGDSSCSRRLLTSSAISYPSSGSTSTPSRRRAETLSWQRQRRGQWRSPASCSSSSSWRISAGARLSTYSSWGWRGGP